MKQTSLVILAAGGSTRFDSQTKKQWLRIEHEPLWLFVTKSLAKLYAFEKIIVVANSDEKMLFEKFCDYTIVVGGEQRQNSIENALDLVSSEYVLISDVARVCADEALIKRLFACEADCVVPFVQTNDTTLLGDELVDRDNIKLIQTPQLSKTKILKDAIKNARLYTDESTLLKAFGAKVSFVQGSNEMHKLTRVQDLQKIPCLKMPSRDIFVGQGFDIHSFEDGKPMILGGLDLGLDYGLKAHSDGDAIIHAIIDALLGACGMGDIGEFFPDNTQEFKDANSTQLLRKTIELSRKIGYKITHIDLSLIAQKPHLQTHKLDMRKNIAKICEMPYERVNLKATRAEKMGFIGRKEGLLAHASISVQFADWSEK